MLKLEKGAVMNRYRVIPLLTLLILIASFFICAEGSSHDGQVSVSLLFAPVSAKPAISESPFPHAPSPVPSSFTPYNAFIVNDPPYKYANTSEAVTGEGYIFYSYLSNNLMRINMDGSGQVVLLDVISPDDEGIDTMCFYNGWLYFRYRGPQMEDGLYICRSDGSDMQLIHSEDTDCVTDDICIAGDKLYYENHTNLHYFYHNYSGKYAYNPSGGYPGIYYRDANGKGKGTIFAVGDYELLFTDGEYVYFKSLDTFTIFRKPLNYGAIQTVFEGDNPGRRPHYIRMRDGWIYFACAQGFLYNYQLWRITADGADQEYLFSVEYTEDIYFFQDNIIANKYDLDDQLYLFNIETGEDTRFFDWRFQEPVYIAGKLLVYDSLRIRYESLDYNPCRYWYYDPDEGIWVMLHEEDGRLIGRQNRDNNALDD